jgi:hypothetical protein
LAARSVAEAFNQFADKITPTADQRTMMSGRRAKAHEVLKDAFAGSNMPLLKTRLIGSAGRNTIGDGVDLLDGGPDWDNCVNGETVLNCES